MSLPDDVENLYEAFSRLRKPKMVPGCPCCSDAAALCKLVETPLRHLSADDLTKYASSAFLTAGSEEDFRYLLPRILEIAVTTPGWWPSPEVVIGKLKLACWESWSSGEKQAVETVLQAWWKALLEMAPNSDPLDPSEFAWRADEFVCGLCLGGVDVEPYLQRLLEARHRDHLRALYWRNVSGKTGRVKLMNAFWQDHRAEGAPLLAFLERDDVTALAALS